METKNSIVCKKCGAQTSGYHISYCPHCGELLPTKSKQRLIDESLIHDKWEEGDEKFYEEEELYDSKDHACGEQLYSERTVWKLYARVEDDFYFDFLVFGHIIGLGVSSILWVLSFFAPIFLFISLVFMIAALVCIIGMGAHIYPSCDINIKDRNNQRMEKAKIKWRKNVGWWRYLIETTTPQFRSLVTLVILEFAVILFLVFKFLL